MHVPDCCIFNEWCACLHFAFRPQGRSANCLAFGQLFEMLDWHVSCLGVALDGIGIINSNREIITAMKGSLMHSWLNCKAQQETNSFQNAATNPNPAVLDFNFFDASLPNTNLINKMLFCQAQANLAMHYPTNREPLQITSKM